MQTFGYYLRKTGACVMMICALLGLVSTYGSRNVIPFSTEPLLAWGFAGLYILIGLFGLVAFLLR